MPITGWRQDHSIRAQDIIRRASVGLIPAIRKLSPETQTKFEARPQFDGVLGKICAFQRTPGERRRGRGVGVRAHGAGQEARQVGKRSLSVLVIQQTAVRLQPLEPCAHGDQVDAMGDADLIGGREQVARRREVASRVGAAVGELRCAVQRGAAANHDGANGLARVDPAARHGGSRPGDSAVEIEAPAGESECRLVEKVGGKDVGFAHARHLLAQENIGEAQRIGRRRIGSAVVHGVNAREGIFIGESLVQARRAKILADMLKGIAECLGDSTVRPRRGEQFRPIGHGPQAQQRLNAGHGSRP